MAQSHPANESMPNHMIIWLDKHIGQPGYCVLLKSSFVIAVDPTTDSFERNLNQDDIDRSIRFGASLRERLNEVEFIFQAFDDIEKCYEAIGKNYKKRIFFITSGSKGKIIVPSLVTLYPGTFPQDNPIFIFCATLLMKPVNNVVPTTNIWLETFVENVLPFVHEDELLACMTREIGSYFATEAQRFNNRNERDKACQYRGWSERMHQRHAILIQQNNA